jgi:molecular chaperone GrpE
MTLKQLSAAFERNRLFEINPMPGEKLDPMKHQAISIVPAEQEANTIVSVLQKGYLIADRLLRPALVTVAQEKS